MEGSCHCGDVRFSITKNPQWLTICNCSICRRISALWTHLAIKHVTISAKKGSTQAYIQGDKSLAIHTCKRCGCTTHWENLKPDEDAYMAVNFRMCPPDEIAQFRIRHFDGADTWEFED